MLTVPQKKKKKTQKFNSSNLEQSKYMWIFIHPFLFEPSFVKVHKTARRTEHPNSHYHPSKLINKLIYCTTSIKSHPYKNRFPQTNTTYNQRYRSLQYTYLYFEFSRPHHQSRPSIHPNHCSYIMRKKKSNQTIPAIQKIKNTKWAFPNRCWS